MNISGKLSHQLQFYLRLFLNLNEIMMFARFGAIFFSRSVHHFAITTISATMKSDEKSQNIDDEHIKQVHISSSLSKCEFKRLYVLHIFVTAVLLYTFSIYLGYEISAMYSERRIYVFRFKIAA